MSDNTLSTPDSFAAMAAERSAAARLSRQRSLRRTLAGVAVAALHVLMIFALIVSIRVPIVPHARTPQEIIFRLIPLVHRVVPPVINATHPKKKEPVFELPTAPITLPPVARAREKTPPVDAMGILGAELACGASRYEYLSPSEKRLCHHAPWEMPANRNLVILPPPEPLPGHLTGAEAAARARAQAAPCPPGMTTPCIDEVIFGKGPH